MFKNILFPADGSQNSKQALMYVKEMAETFQAKVTILNTYELPLFVNNLQVSADIYDQIVVDSTEESKNILGEAQKVFQGSSISPQLLSLQGHTARLIIETANLQNCDLIIMGSRGLGSVKSILLGSVSNYVLHQAKCPVLIVYEENKS